MSGAIGQAPTSPCCHPLLTIRAMPLLPGSPPALTTTHPCEQEAHRLLGDSGLDGSERTSDSFQRPYSNQGSGGGGEVVRRVGWTICDSLTHCPSTGASTLEDKLPRWDRTMVWHQPSQAGTQSKEEENKE